MRSTVVAVVPVLLRVALEAAPGDMGTRTGLPVGPWAGREVGTAGPAAAGVAPLAAAAVAEEEEALVCRGVLCRR